MWVVANLCIIKETRNIYILLFQADDTDVAIASSSLLSLMDVVALEVLPETSNASSGNISKSLKCVAAVPCCLTIATVCDSKDNYLACVHSNISRLH